MRVEIHVWSTRTNQFVASTHFLKERSKLYATLFLVNKLQAKARFGYFLLSPRLYKATTSYGKPQGSGKKFRHFLELRNVENFRNERSCRVRRDWMTGGDFLDWKIQIERVYYGLPN